MHALSIRIVLIDSFFCIIKIKNANTRLKVRNMLVSSSEWTLDKRIERKHIHPSVFKFCAGLPVYRLRETQTIQDNMVIVQDSGKE